MRYIWFIISLLFVFACGDGSRKEELSGDSNKIIFLDYYYSCYLNELKKGKESSLALFQKHVAKPLRDYIANAEYFETFGNWDSTVDTNGLRIAIQKIRLSEQSIKDDIRTSLRLCNAQLAHDSLNVYILPVSANGDTILTKMHGVAGITVGSKHVIISIDPSINGWDSILKVAMAHEFHHAYSMSLEDPDAVRWDLLDRLICEGRADAFAHKLYPNVILPWTVAQDGEKINLLWDKLKTKLQNQDYMFGSEVMFGSAEWPAWTGYTLGYSIVQSCLKNKPQMSVVEWTKMKPEEILKCSDFK